MYIFIILNDRFSDASIVASYLKRILNLYADDFLIHRFLRVCKFNLEKTKTRMQNYYKQRSHLTEWYLNQDPFRSELQELLELG